MALPPAVLSCRVCGLHYRNFTSPLSEATFPSAAALPSSSTYPTQWPSWRPSSALLSGNFSFSNPHYGSASLGGESARKRKAERPHGTGDVQGELPFSTSPMTRAANTVRKVIPPEILCEGDLYVVLRHDGEVCRTTSISYPLGSPSGRFPDASSPLPMPPSAPFIARSGEKGKEGTKESGLSRVGTTTNTTMHPFSTEASRRPGDPPDGSSHAGVLDGHTARPSSNPLPTALKEKEEEEEEQHKENTKKKDCHRHKNKSHTPLATHAEEEKPYGSHPPIPAALTGETTHHSATTSSPPISLPCPTPAKHSFDWEETFTFGFALPNESSSAFSRGSGRNQKEEEEEERGDEPPMAMPAQGGEGGRGLLPLPSARPPVLPAPTVGATAPGPLPFTEQEKRGVWAAGREGGTGGPGVAHRPPVPPYAVGRRDAPEEGFVLLPPPPPPPPGGPPHGSDPHRGAAPLPPPLRPPQSYPSPPAWGAGGGGGGVLSGLSHPPFSSAPFPRPPAVEDRSSSSLRGGGGGRGGPPESGGRHDPNGRPPSSLSPMLPFASATSFLLPLGGNAGGGGSGSLRMTPSYPAFLFPPPPGERLATPTAVGVLEERRPLPPPPPPGRPPSRTSAEYPLVTPPYRSAGGVLSSSSSSSPLPSPPPPLSSSRPRAVAPSSVLEVELWRSWEGGDACVGRCAIHLWWAASGGPASGRREAAAVGMGGPSRHRPPGMVAFGEGGGDEGSGGSRYAAAAAGSSVPVLSQASYSPPGSYGIPSAPPPPPLRRGSPGSLLPLPSGGGVLPGSSAGVLGAAFSAHGGGGGGPLALPRSPSLSFLPSSSTLPPFHLASSRRAGEGSGGGGGAFRFSGPASHPSSPSPPCLPPSPSTMGTASLLHEDSLLLSPHSYWVCLDEEADGEEEDEGTVQGRGKEEGKKTTPHAIEKGKGRKRGGKIIDKIFTVRKTLTTEIRVRLRLQCQCFSEDPTEKEEGGVGQPSAARHASAPAMRDVSPAPSKKKDPCRRKGGRGETKNNKKKKKAEKERWMQQWFCHSWMGGPLGILAAVQKRTSLPPRSSSAAVVRPRRATVTSPSHSTVRG